MVYDYTVSDKLALKTSINAIWYLMYVPVQTVECIFSNALAKWANR